MPIPQIPTFKTFQDVSNYLARLRLSLEGSVPVHLERDWALGLATLSTESPSVSIPEVVPPPANPVVIPSSVGLSLLWDAPNTAEGKPDPSIKAFEVRRANDSGMTSGVTSLGTVSALRVTDSMPPALDQIFYYQVRSVRYNGLTSVWTPPVTGATSGIRTEDIQDGAITTLKIASLAVTGPKVGPLAISTDKIAANAVTLAKFDRAVTNKVVYSQGVGADSVWTDSPVLANVTTTTALKVSSGGSAIAALRWGATSVADGGTITHGLGATPTAVLVTPSISGEMASVTAVSGTTFTVALKKHDGTGGTTQTVSWMALV